MASSMGCVRIETRGREVIDGNLGAHIRGEIRPDEAVERPEFGRAVDRLGGDREAALRALDEYDGQPRSAGRPANEGFELLISGPPRFDAPDAWPTEKVARWGAASFEWVDRAVRKAGAAGVVSDAVMHLDESAPHIHVGGVPVVWDHAKERVKLSKAEVEHALVGRRIKNYRERGRALQDRFFEDVGRHFGLERGVRGSGRRHEAPDRTKGLTTRVEESQARAVEAHEAAERLQREMRRQRSVEARAADTARSKAKATKDRDQRAHKRELLAASKIPAEPARMPAQPEMPAQPARNQGRGGR